MDFTIRRRCGSGYLRHRTAASRSWLL